ncbi:DUF3772 domain-containing protein [Xanthobacter agilis]|uniref:Small-conductance mechanosensitive channel n=1 Tax=Xanthobacter agilis TaxID=47492 RepID=A0ABU0LGP3_XANAG|nr:DUF3772 domain-containing protein [Xanthobacter agilis]MDQ0506322.1 small-conductance mechanosensitive channel [Xanthobacter agilis]
MRLPKKLLVAALVLWAGMLGMDFDAGGQPSPAAAQTAVQPTATGTEAKKPEGQKPDAQPEAGKAAEAAAPAAPPPPPKALPPDPLVTAAREKIEANRAALDALEAGLSVEGLRASDLDDLRGRLDPIRRDLQQLADDIGPRLADARVRLKSIPPKPGEGAPPEDPGVTADRDRLQKTTGDLDAVLGPIRTLADRGAQATDRISARRRALFTSQLFERSDSILDPGLWAAAIAATGSEVHSTQLLISDWSTYAARRHEPLALTGILVGTFLVVALVVFVGRWLRARLRTPRPPGGETFTRLRSAREALKVLVLEATVAPVATVLCVSIIDAFEIIPPRADDLVHGIAIAIIIKAIGTGAARAMLAPGEPWRRMPPISDRAAVITFRYFSWAVWALVVAAVLNALHRVLFVPVGLTVVTSAIMALLIAAFIARFLLHLASSEEDEEAAAQNAPQAAETGRAQAHPIEGRLWVRFLVWLVVALVIGALVTGYVSFAAFVASRVVVASAILGILYVLYGLIDAFFSTGLAADTPRARHLSKTLGLKPANLELIGVIVAGLLKLLLFMVAAFLIVGSWGASSTDLMDTMERLSFGIHVGSITISLSSVLYAAIYLLVGIVIARGLQGWISASLLPRTGLEPSLQSSISTIVGYVGVIIAIMGSMSELGLNLENIALVAGALSVGIGFGLQAIVSNFVSGLILLAERPIRVGDTINVKGEEGYVRRISVRSTEIETFDRASVIVPNTDLITGMVKNWTHANTTGRIIITLNVAYDADAEQVRDILVSCACTHPQVLQSPPPRVFLTKFLDSGMVFELRCVVANVDYSLTVKSDLHFQILAKFRAAEIGLVSQPWASLGRAPTALVPQQPSAGGALPDGA